MVAVPRVRSVIQAVSESHDDSSECDMTNAHLSGLVTALVIALAVRHPVISIASPPELSQQLEVRPRAIVWTTP